MTEGGGSLFLKKEGRYIGPGHAAVFSEGMYIFSKLIFRKKNKDVFFQKLKVEGIGSVIIFMMKKEMGCHG